MEVGDRVVSLGDTWMPAGSKGIVEAIKYNSFGNRSILVNWHSSSSKQVPVRLYHKMRYIVLDTDNTSINPNFLFKRRG